MFYGFASPMERSTCSKPKTRYVKLCCYDNTYSVSQLRIKKVCSTKSLFEKTFGGAEFGVGTEDRIMTSGRLWAHAFCIRDLTFFKYST